MCAWAADSSKLLRPLSRMIVQGVDTTAFVDLDSWLLPFRRWLELDDTLQVTALCGARGNYYSLELGIACPSGLTYCPWVPRPAPIAHGSPALLPLK